jgi:hypothetical protein
MKITKRQLQRIIKEEKARLLERSGGLDAYGPDDYTDYVIRPTVFVNAAEKYLTDEELAGIGRDKIEGIAIDNANALAWRLEDSQEGFGSSDRSAYVKYYLDDLGSYAARSGMPGFTADWKGPQGSLQIVREGKVRVTKKQLKRIIEEALAGPPTTVEGWMYWGGEFGLSAEEDNDGQTIFYLSADQPDRAKIAAEAIKFGAQVDTDYDGNDVIYTGVYNNAGEYEEGGVWSDEKDYEAGFKS